ncbi:hypothetical protein [Peptostreptococcus faecalis]|uniref:hypothetical protein n=1 Tax=Peptostreptococcus faecalis TaxID=2045015 RepID=UPI001FA8C0DC|nr:hypothetical protein [Peptostreptococcus faecalis]
MGLDTTVSPRGQSNGFLSTFVEIKTRMYVAIKMSNRSKKSMYEAIKKLVSAFPKKYLKVLHLIEAKNLHVIKKLRKI